MAVDGAAGFDIRRDFPSTAFLPLLYDTAEVDPAAVEAECHAVVGRHRDALPFSPPRNALAVPLCAPGGHWDDMAKAATESRATWEPLRLTALLEEMPATSRLLERLILPLVDELPRIVVMVPAPGGVSLHRDGRPGRDMHALIKLRYLVSGRMDGIRFASRSRGRLPVDMANRFFCINGSIPHEGLPDDMKLICSGVPARYNDTFVDLANRSAAAFADRMVTIAPDDHPAEVPDPMSLG